MNRNAATFMELLLTLSLTAIVATAIVMTGLTSMKASSMTDKKILESSQSRNAAAIFNNLINASNINYLTIKSCNEGTHECHGKKIIFKGPVVDATFVANSPFTPDGRLKYGANGKQNCRYEYYVNWDNELILDTQCATGGYCGDNDCVLPETKESCLIDCGICGDLKCTPEKGEDLNNCEDCKICGDYVCSLGEICSNCPLDCGNCRAVGGGGGKNNNPIEQQSLGGLDPGA